MYVFILLSAIMAMAISAPTAEEPVAILKQSADVLPDGSFKWDFESADGTKQEQSGSVKAGAEPDETVSAIQGSASWTDPDGNQHELVYVADENGFQPQSADVPQPPEIPAQIARALEWIAAHPEPEEPQQ